MAKKNKAVKASAKKMKKASSRTSAKAHVLKAADMAKLQLTVNHPLNPDAEVTAVRMAAHLGLKRTGVNFVRVPAGKEAYVAHAHQFEEEWVYILYGTGEALIGDDWIEVATGDFVAYPAPQVVHSLRSSGAEELVCLMGGERLDFEVVEYPTVGRRSVRVGDVRTLYDAKAGTVLTRPKKK